MITDEFKVGESLFYEMRNFGRSICVKVKVVGVTEKRVLIELPQGERKSVRPYRLRRQKRHYR